jgi:hypothetical protein
MKADGGGVDVQIRVFLTSAPAGGEWSASRPGRFTPGDRGLGTHWIGGWVDPRDGLDNVDKRKFLTLPGVELRPLGRTARSQSLTDYATPDPNTDVSYILGHQLANNPLFQCIVFILRVLIIYLCMLIGEL